MKGCVNMNLKLIKKSIEYSQDIVNITKEYAETMDSFFSNLDNQIQYKYCYDEYKKFSDNLKEKAKIRGLIK